MYGLVGHAFRGLSTDQTAAIAPISNERSLIYGQTWEGLGWRSASVGSAS